MVEGAQTIHFQYTQGPRYDFQIVDASLLHVTHGIHVNGSFINESQKTVGRVVGAAAPVLHLKNVDAPMAPTLKRPLRYICMYIFKI